MSNKMKRLSSALLIILASFVLSFFNFNGVYFAACAPFIISTFLVKGENFLYCFLGMLIASFILAGNLPIMISVIFFFVVLAIFAIKRMNLNTMRYVVILSGVIGFLISISQTLKEHSVETAIGNALFVTTLACVISYNLYSISADLKFRENFSITKKQLIFSSFLFNFIIGGLSISADLIALNFVAVCIINYLLVRIDSVAGITGVFTFLIVNLNSSSYILVLSLLPLIYAFRFFSKSIFVKSVSFFAISLILMRYFQDFSFIEESIIITISLILIPDSVIRNVSKYIVEYKDYELKLYQASYYKCLKRNKKIQQVMEMLEKQLSGNSKAKKASKDILLQDMQFLSNKLKEEENIKVKENILNEIKYNSFEILGLKIFNDYFSNYNIIVEVNESVDNINSILKILEYHLGIRLKVDSLYHNRVLGSYKIVFVNNEKYSLKFSVKQRSKDQVCCGDSYLNFNVKNKKYFLISDGMGYGKRASQDSMEALILLKDFIELGMSTFDAINSCNAIIFSKDNEKFNTLDLLEYDIFDDKMYLYKNGSNVTYVKDTNGVKKIVSENLPLGIVENIKVEKLEIKEIPQCIVLTSDGFIKDFSEIINCNKAKSNKTLINEIFQYEGNKIDDDQTIVVINIKKNR